MAKSTELAHNLEALLHTIRCIAEHEDELCTLLHEAQRTGRTTSSLRSDLQTILADLPSADYLHDLDAVRSALEPETVRSAA